MVRVLRYPYLTGLTCLCAVSCAVARDLCVGAGLLGWARVLLICTFVLLGLCFSLLSCRFFVDELGVGVGFLLRVRRTAWHELASVGVLSCNSRRTYLYGLYTHSTGFLELLHRAPGCGSWGFVVPTSRRLVSAVLDLCPEEIDFTPAPRKHPVNPLRPLWHQAAMYMLLLIPGGALAFFTGAMMLGPRQRNGLSPFRRRADAGGLRHVRGGAFPALSRARRRDHLSMDQRRRCPRGHRRLHAVGRRAFRLCSPPRTGQRHVSALPAA